MYTYKITFTHNTHARTVRTHTKIDNIGVNVIIVSRSIYYVP